MLCAPTLSAIFGEFIYALSAHENENKDILVMKKYLR